MGSRQQGADAAIALGECHPFAKPGHQCFVRWARRFEFGCLPRQCVHIQMQQSFEQGFPRREMALQGAQPDVGPAGDFSHGRVCTMLGYDVARDRKQAVVIPSSVGSQNFLIPLTSGSVTRIMHPVSGSVTRIIRPTDAKGNRGEIRRHERK